MYCSPKVTSRLDFIWKEQAERELTNMKSNRALNDTLIKVTTEASPPPISTPPPHVVCSLIKCAI